MICVGFRGIGDCVAQVIEGLKARGLYPEAEGRRPSARKAVTTTPGEPLRKDLREKILSSRGSMEGERKQVTVLFADIAGFTSISEDMDPEQARDFVNQCLVIMADEVYRYEGTVAQFLGDGVMALFGAPIAHEDDPQRALHAALGIRERLRDHANKLKQQGIDFDIHIGVNTGLVVVGRIGDDLSMDYTAVGDTVNLASRMQSTAGPGAIRVAESTHRLTAGYFDFQPLGEVEVKGKKQPVKAYELLRAGRARTRMGMSVARGLTPFVGRESELQKLMKCYERAKKGQGQVVGIVGEPGVGKSRLVLQMKGGIPRDECTCLQGECLHYGEASPYLPVLDILRSYFGLEEGELESVAKTKMSEKVRRLDESLESLLPPLHDILSLKVEDEQYLKLELQKKRERTFEAIRNLWTQESQSRPLIVIVEDLHWMDKTSEEFLDHLIGRLPGARLLLLLLYRPQYTHSWGSKTYYSQISLDEFPPDTSTEMVHAFFREGQAAPDLGDLILKKAAGNALFMEELTRALLDRGYLRRSDGEYALAVDPSEIHVPETIQGIIGARIDGLEENIKQTIQVASVIGREFPLAMLQKVLAAEQGLEEHLSALQGLELVYEKSTFPKTEYVFKHALTHDVAYNSLLLKRRKEIHQRIGKGIEELYPERLEEFYEMLAHHFVKSNDLDKAYQYLKLSGDKAARSCSNSEANRFYREAIKVLDELPRSEQNRRSGVEVRLSLALPMMSYPDECLRILEDGVAIAKELGDSLSLAKLYSWIGMYHSLSGRPLLGIQYSEESFREAERVKAVDIMAPNAFHLCSSYFFTGENCPKMIELASKTIALLEETQRQSESFGTMNPYATLHSYYGTAMDMLGRFQEGQTAHEKALGFALGLKDLNVMTLVENNFGWCLLLQKGDAAKAADHLRECVRYGEEASLLGILGAGLTGLGWSHYILGQLEDAEKQISQGLKIQKDSGMTYLMSLHHCAMSLLHYELGDIEKAHICAQEAVTSSQSNNEKFMEGLSWALLGRTLGRLNRSEYAAAKEHVMRGIGILDERGLRPPAAQANFYLGELHSGADQRDQATRALEKAQTMFQEMGMDYWLARAEAALATLQS